MEAVDLEGAGSVELEEQEEATGVWKLEAGVEGWDAMTAMRQPERQRSGHQRQLPR